MIWRHNVNLWIWKLWHTKVYARCTFKMSKTQELYLTKGPWTPCVPLTISNGLKPMPTIKQNGKFSHSHFMITWWGIMQVDHQVTGTKVMYWEMPAKLLLWNQHPASERSIFLRFDDNKTNTNLDKWSAMHLESLIWGAVFSCWQIRPYK